MAHTPVSHARHERDFTDALTTAAASLRRAVTPAQCAAMFEHFCRMVDANRRFNLTRITSPVEAAVKHYADALTLLAAPWVDAAADTCLLDVGTGAGFPAVPLAIVCERWHVTAIDGTGKKARFVADCAAALGLANLTVRHARAADLPHDRAASFDLVVLRAVSTIAAGLREVHPLVRPGGSVVFYKSATLDPRELEDGRRQARALHLDEAEPLHLTLPAPDGPLSRQLVRYTR